MPTIQVTVPSEMWSEAEKADISASLTNGVGAVAQKSGKGDMRAHVTVQIIEASLGGYASGGAVLA